MMSRILIDEEKARKTDLRIPVHKKRFHLPITSEITVCVSDEIGKKRCSSV